MVDQELVVALLGSLQACASVLLTMIYGVLARKLKLLQETSINESSALGVKLFLPALVLVKLGQELHLQNALNYVPILGMKDLQRLCDMRSIRPKQRQANFIV